MSGKPRFVAGCAAFAASCLAWVATALPAQEASDLQLLLPGAKEVEKKEQSLSPEQIAKIERSTGGKFPGADKPWTVFHCQAVPPAGGAPQALRAVFLPLEIQKDAMLAVAANAAGETAALAVIQGKSVDKSRSPMLEQFQGSWGLRLAANSENPPSHLAELQKKAQTGSDPESKKLQALLRQKQLMIENNRWDALATEQIRSKDDQAPYSSRELAKVIAQLAEFAPKMAVVLEPAELKIYQNHFNDMKKSADAASAALNKKEKEWDLAGRSMRSLNNHCAKCHTWETHHFGKPLETAMIGLREEMGIGQGYFVVGHDVLVPEGTKREEAQAIAFAVKRALWILKFSFAEGGAAGR